MRKTAIVLFLLAASALGQTGNTFYAVQFPGSTVGAKVTAAQAACSPNTSIQCVIVIDPVLAVWTIGVMPMQCPNCTWADYRSVTPFGSGSSYVLPAATAVVLGGVKPDGTTLANTAGAISCAQATTSQAGCVKPDGTTITATGGVISAVGSGSFPHWNTGLIETFGQTGVNTLGAMGDGFSQCTSATSVAQPPTSSAPTEIQSTSGASAGNCAGWVGEGSLWLPRSPLLTFGISYNVAGDYTNSRILLGFMQYNTTLPLITASDNPSLNFAAIRWSVSASDTYYMCVTSNGTSVTATPIGTTSPSTAYTIMSLNVNGTTSVSCTVGTTTVTNTTNLPSSSMAYMPMFVDDSYVSGAVHLRLSGGYAYSQNGQF